MAASKIEARLQEWKRKLIDLTRRNRLLFFTPTRSSSLKVIEPSPIEVFKRLVVDEKPWRFFIPPDENEEQAEGTSELILPLTPHESEDSSAKPIRMRRPNELLCQAREGRKLRAVLRNLHRRSRSDFEERGVRILHVVSGMLEWRETPQSEPALSPLILVPAQMSRESANDPFELRLADEDVILNPAIEVRLWNDFRIQLPPLPEDWEERDLNSYLAEVEKQVLPQGWKVHTECWVGLFSFHKLVIYQDLDSHGELIKQHSMVCALARETDISDVTTGSPLEPRQLDDLINPKDSYLIMDADSSQLACIEAVKRNGNLVIQGPPGTGKSQTIANLVAESIAAGRKVLFVSEKMAALEVVYKRILDANLGHYCLELHSHKANKREVVAELHRCYLDSLQPKAVMTELELQQLTERRRQLNDYVNALHLVRDPLGKSAYHALGELAELEGVPFVPAGHIQAETLDPAQLDAAIQLVRRLAPVWKVAVEGERFPWRGCKETSYGPGTSITYQAVIKSCGDARIKLAEEGQRVGDALGCITPMSLSDAEWLLQTGELLGKGPGVQVAWLEAPELQPFLSEAQRQSKISSQRLSIKGELSHRYTDAFFDIPSTLKDELTGALDSVSSSFGWEIHNDPRFVSERRTILSWLQNLLDRLNDWIRDANMLSNLLGFHADQNIEGLWRLVRIAELCESNDRPDRKWFDPLILEDAPQVLSSLRRDHEARMAARSEILAEYDESLLSQDLDLFIGALAGRYASPLRWLKPGFYRLRQQVRRCRKDAKNPRDILKDLHRARNLVQLEAKIQSESSRSKEVLGAWYRGYDTNITLAEQAIGIAKELIKLTGGDPSDRLVRQACFGSLPSPELRQAARRLKESLRAWEDGTASIKRFVPLDRLPSTGLPLRQSRLEAILSWNKEVLQAFKATVDRLDAAESSLRFNLERQPKEILDDLSQLVTLRDLESQVFREADRLKELYGSYFFGLNTDWDGLIAAMEWTQRLRDHLGKRSIPERVMEVASHGASTAPKIDSLRSCIQEFRAAFHELDGRFEQPSKPGFLTTAEEKLSGNLEPPALITGPFVQRDFDNLKRQLAQMRTRIDEIRDWVDYKSIESDFLKASLQKLHAEIVSRPSLPPDKLPDIVRRALLQAWIDWLFKEEPPLGRFRAQNHEMLVTEFRELDRKHCQFGAHRVILEAERRKPKDLTLQPGGEVAVLFTEANKKKRHLPIRRLFSRIPNILARLKPCLLMSPLSVSQFLDPQQIQFDLVIFDEASQICSEDAIGAIYRGRQLVVCGDNKQLPPTMFFEQGMSDEFEDEDTPEAFDVFESILDECAAIGMPPGWLRWHYRSRHESLIAFSNRRFYDDRLVTFPASRREHPSLGIQFVHVPDGVYDRGGRRDNPREAEVVVDLVLQHFLRYPNRSLGVVAFSIAQMNAIEDRLEQLWRERPELERHFRADRLEGFFVKNLENVQGDERDVIIFSVGYGKDQSGKLWMHFGPLNLAGGERRLNVAITRAREKVIVVSSIRAADMDLSATQAPGVLNLYHYLDYAERGPDALALRHPGASGDFESPLERDVAGAIRALGYEVVAQVGCSNFRIDLGVVDPAEPGRFILGVECDGATYHSAYTARDRDRLRQEVLRKLGWKIHRVWAPDWVTRRETEIRRLQEALEQARMPVAQRDNHPTSQSETEGAAGSVVIRNNPPPLENKDALPKWAVPYIVCRIETKSPRGLQFHDPAAAKDLAFMLKEVVDVEGPVHIDVAARRLGDAWGLRKTGSRMMQAVKEALGLLTTGGAAYVQGRFLWPKRKDFTLKVRRPNPDDEDTVRKIELIPDEELELATQNIVQDAISITEEDLVTQVARFFGFDRTGENIRERIGWSLQQMIKEGALVRKGDRITLA